MLTPYTYTPAPPDSPEAAVARAESELLNAQRFNGEDSPTARLAAGRVLTALRAQAAAATQREAARLAAIGPAGRDYERQAAAYHYATR